MSDALINGLAGAGGGIIAQLITYPLQTVFSSPQISSVQELSLAGLNLFFWSSVSRFWAVGSSDVRCTQVNTRQQTDRGRGKTSSRDGTIAQMYQVRLFDLTLEQFFLPCKRGCDGLPLPCCTPYDCSDAGDPPGRMAAALRGTGPVHVRNRGFAGISRKFFAPVCGCALLCLIQHYTP